MTNINELDYLKSEINTCEDSATIHDALPPKVNIFYRKKELQNSLWSEVLMILTLFWVFANQHNLLGLRRFSKTQNNVKSAKPRPNGVLQLPLDLKAIDRLSFARPNLVKILNKLCCLGHPIGEILQISSIYTQTLEQKNEHNSLSTHAQINSKYRIIF